ncbi:hypothetical protein GLYMA_13G159550v4 [Glycine max]|nr:hypothetical protein GLYMA_13G159550v4 [Glycine max]
MSQNSNNKYASIILLLLLRYVLENLFPLPSMRSRSLSRLQCLVPQRLWCLASLPCGQGGHGGNGRSQHRRCEMHGVRICIERVTKMADP